MTDDSPRRDSHGQDSSRQDSLRQDSLRNSGPFDFPAPDEGADMKGLDLAQDLLRWDELPPDRLGVLEADEVQGPRLRRLQAAEAWLAMGGTGGSRSGTPGSRSGTLRERTLGAECPEPEALYDFARGPGYAPLPAASRAAIADHVAECGTCAGLCATLESFPPPPLEIPTREPLPGRRRPRLVPSHPARSRWIPAAAAAAVLVGSFLAFRAGGGVEASGWPTPPLLRRAGEEALWYPRGRVLHAGPAGFAAGAFFELAPVPGAERYRVRVLGHGGSAFDVGHTVAVVEGQRGELTLDAALGAGHYTWEAWAVVDGLERALGERDFRIVVDRDVQEDLGDARSPVERVRVLHEAGYVTDARHLARSLSPSAERDAYLAPPGR